MNNYNNKEFLQYWFKGKRQEEQIAVGPVYSQLLFDDVEKAYEHVAGKADQYFHVCTQDSEQMGKGRGTIKSARFMPGLWVDIDVGDKENGKHYFPSKEAAYKALNGLPLPPTFVIDSGAGLHAYWKLQSALWAHDYSHLDKDWIQYLRTAWEVDLDSVGDLSRVLRIPGTIHRSSNNPVLWVNGSEEVYSLEQFSPYIDIAKSPLQDTSISADLHLQIGNNLYPPTDKLTKLQSSESFNQIWLRTKKIGDGSASEYDMSIATHAALRGWEPQEIANLLVHNRKLHGDKVKPAGYFERTIKKALQAAEEQGVGLLPNNVAEVLTLLDQIPDEELGVRGLDVVAQSQLGPVEQEQALVHIKSRTKVGIGVLRAQLATVKRAMFGEFKIKQRQWIDDYNDRFALITGSGRAEILEIKPSGMIRHNKESFKLLTANDRIGSDSKGDLWMEHPDRRAIEEIVFDPRLPAGLHGAYYNMWDGFAVEPDPTGDCALYWELVRKVICNGDPALFHFVQRWMAHAIQRPHDLPGVALVMQSEQGTGKNQFVDWFGRLFGTHYVAEASMERIFGSFNAHVGNSIVLFANEAFFGGDKRQQGKLKTLITDDQKTIEEKYKAAIVVRNMTRLIIASNEDWVIPADGSERRFVTLPVNTARRQDFEFFGALIAQMKNKGINRLLHDLSTLDISDWCPLSAAQSLHAHSSQNTLFEQKMLGMHIIDQWWMHCLEQGHIADEYRPADWQADWSKEALWVSNDTLNLLCNSFAQNYGHRESVSPTWIGRRLKVLCPELQFKWTHTTVKGRVFPTLLKSRKLFMKAYNLTDWKVIEGMI